jgi:hypothetical protein
MKAEVVANGHQSRMGFDRSCSTLMKIYSTGASIDCKKTKAALPKQAEFGINPGSETN